MRLFVAVPLPDPLAAILEPVAAAMPRARWRAEAPSRRHVTVAFLGEVEVGAVARILRGLAAAGARPAFELGLAGLGAFPEPRRPAVLFAGAAAGADDFRNLVAAVSAGLRMAGCPPAAGGQLPHATLARRRAGVPAAAAAADVAAAIAAHGLCPWGRLEVSAVTLFCSERGPAPAHRALGRVALAPRAGMP